MMTPPLSGMLTFSEVESHALATGGSRTFSPGMLPPLAIPVVLVRHVFASQNSCAQCVSAVSCCLAVHTNRAAARAVLSSVLFVRCVCVCGGGGSALRYAAQIALG